MLFFSFLTGFCAGLRSLTPPAVVAWAAYLGWMKLQGPLVFMGTLYAVAIFSVLALGELAADKWWAKIPNRTAIPALLARVLTGGLTGACIAFAAGQGIGIGAGLGAIGGIAGAFSGFHTRRYLVKGCGLPDFPVALSEDVICLVGCLWIVMRFA